MEGLMMAKVLIIDQDKDTREFLVSLLHHEGFEAEELEDSRDLQDKLKRFQPDLITFEPHLQTLKTDALHQMLEEHAPTSKMIVLSVMRQEEPVPQQIQSMKTTVDHICKPFDITQLMQTITNHTKEDDA